MIYALTQVAEGEIAAYLDADTFMFSSPRPLYDTFTDYSIMITPHNFSPDNAFKARISGIFNAGMIFFRKDSVARSCLERWRKQCIEWCYNRREKDRFGDQLYLNEWPTLYPGVLSVDYPGVNLGPWNIKNYHIHRTDNKIFIDTVPLIWYHYHPLKLYEDTKGILQAYPVSIYNEHIYRPYIETLRRSLTLIRDTYDRSFSPLTDPRLGFVRRLKQEVLRRIS
jgi:hypothetical protein